MDKQEAQKNTEVQYNLGARQLQIIGNLLETASSGYLKGDFDNWFFSLKNIKFQIVSRLKEEERLELTKKEGLIARALLIYHRDKEHLACKALTSRLIERYETRIKELLEIRGFLVPLKADSTSLFNQRIPEE